MKSSLKLGQHHQESYSTNNRLEEYCQKSLLRMQHLPISNHQLNQNHYL